VPFLYKRAIHRSAMFVSSLSTPRLLMRKAALAFGAIRANANGNSGSEVRKRNQCMVLLKPKLNRRHVAPQGSADRKGDELNARKF